jgi:hypothetical protein
MLVCRVHFILCRSRRSRSWLIGGLLLSLVAMPKAALARDDDAPAIVSYGFNGFWTGAQVGLASGFLATGSEYESDEWRKLAFGTGVGALVGVGVGLTLGVVDLGQQQPRTGWLVLRDMGYGVSLGSVVGAATGALFLIDSGEPKDVLTGAAYGSIFGAVVGIAFGVIESSMAARHPEPLDAPPPPVASVHFTLVGSEGSYVPMPAIRGSF